MVGRLVKSSGIQDMSLGRRAIQVVDGGFVIVLFEGR